METSPQSLISQPSKFPYSDGWLLLCTQSPSVFSQPAPKVMSQVPGGPGAGVGGPGDGGPTLKKWLFSDLESAMKPSQASACNRCKTSAGDISGSASKIRAAAPDTCGAAMEVPDFVESPVSVRKSAA